MARASRPNMPVATGRAWGKGLNERLDSCKRFVAATHHHAVAFSQSPHSAGRSDIHEFYTDFGEDFLASDRIIEVGISAVEYHVAV